MLESLHRADRAVVVLQDALKGPANAVDPATTRGHELTHGANVLQLSTADRRKFEDMLATAQVSTHQPAPAVASGVVACLSCLQPWCWVYVFGHVLVLLSHVWGAMLVLAAGRCSSVQDCPPLQGAGPDHVVERGRHPQVSGFAVPPAAVLATHARSTALERGGGSGLLFCAQAAPTIHPRVVPVHCKAGPHHAVMCCVMVCRAYRALALKHHPDKALQHCRWSAKLGRCGAAAAHVTAASGGVEASLKAAANEVFGFLSAAHEELTNVTSRSKVSVSAEFGCAGPTC